MNDFKSGFVALIGRPNVGKSTLLNYLVQDQVAITSPKPQTTRNKIAGIYNDPSCQIVLVDTPGIFSARTKLDNYMDKASFSSLNDVDQIIFLVEPDKPDKATLQVLNSLKKIKLPVYLAINKIDQVHPDQLLPIIDAYRQLFHFQDYLPISAKKGIGITDLLETIKKALPAGPKYYDTDQFTDRPEYFMVAELIRKQILLLTGQEVPHASCVVVEKMRDHEKGKLQVIATIYVEKNGQKGIMIGKGAQMLKKIGIRSRKEIENLLGEKINLQLTVKVHPNWRQDSQFLRQIGYDKKELS